MFYAYEAWQAAPYLLYGGEIVVASSFSKSRKRAQEQIEKLAQKHRADGPVHILPYIEKTRP